MPDEPGEIEPLRSAHEYEVPMGGGKVLILRGNPRYCPNEQVHDPHTFTYKYLSRDGNVVPGEYHCFGDPAPWADQFGRCPGCDLPLSVNDWCPRCLKFAAEFGSKEQP